MKKQLITNLVFPLIISVNVILFACTFTDLLNEYKEQHTTIQDRSYSIEPATLLESIRNGNSRNFSLLTSTPPANPTPSKKLISWSQTEYLSIAEALFQFVWQESTQDWKLGRMGYFLKCNEISHGPQSSQFFFYKAIKDSQNDIANQSVRFERFLRINPDENTAEISEYKFYPDYSGLTFIEIAKNPIDIGDAIQIAENNGGTKFRQENEEKCVINAKLDPNGKYKGWEISYISSSSTKNADRLHLEIDPLTGIAKVIR